MFDTGIQVFGMDLGMIVQSFLTVVGALVVIGKTIAVFTPTDKDDKFFDKLSSLLNKVKGVFTKKDVK